jgi:Fe-S-cluster containining protein
MNRHSTDASVTFGTWREDTIAAPCAWCVAQTFGHRLVDGVTGSVSLPLCDKCSGAVDRDPEFRTTFEVIAMVMIRRRPAPGQRVLPFLELPVLPADDPCRGCGACCLHLGWPPFWGPREYRWRRLRREHPGLAMEIDRVRWLAQTRGEHGPCIWFDPSTRRCRHYELRPEACREFEPGGEYCQRFRMQHGVEGTEEHFDGYGSAMPMGAVE